jgi:hypothetical protein
MAGGLKNPILLDWVNIRYRTLFQLVLVALVLVAAVTGTWSWWAHRDPVRIEARQAIEEAATRVQEAENLDLSATAFLPPLLEAARTSLTRAEEAFARTDYEDAVGYAAQARESAVAVLQARRGTEAVQEVRFYRVEGEVKVKRAKRFDWEEAGPHTLLRPGDQIKTSSSGSAQIIYFDGTITTIKPGSLLEIKELYQNPSTKVQKVAEKLNWGSVSASTQAASTAGSFHEVTTQTSRARTEHPAEFGVSYNRETGQSSVDLYSGAVNVSAGREEITDLEPGERLTMSGDRIDSRTRLLPSPGLVAPGDQWTFNHPDPEQDVTSLRWEEVKGARHYHLQVSDGALFSRNIYERTDLAEATVDLEGLPAGGYYWRVACRDGDGVEGPWSMARKFRIISKQLGPSHDVTPPELVLEEFIQSGPMVILAGKTEPGAQLWITSHGTTKRVDVDGSGRFTTVLKLTREGQNQIQVRAQDAAGNESVVTRMATVRTF